MMTTKAWILRGILILCATLVASCIDIREEYWLHDDGSVAAELTYRMPSTATMAVGGRDGIETILNQVLAKNDLIDRFETQVTEVDKQTRILIRVKVDNVTKLDDLKLALKQHKELPEPAKQMMGEIRVKLESPSSLSVTREISLSKAIPALQWLPKSQLVGHQVEHIIHLPQSVVSSNADNTWDDGKSLSWEIPLADAIRAPIITRVEVRLPIPWLWITIVAAALVSLIIMGFRMRKARRLAAGLPPIDTSAKESTC